MKTYYESNKERARNLAQSNFNRFMIWVMMSLLVLALWALIVVSVDSGPRHLLAAPFVLSLYFAGKWYFMWRQAEAIFRSFRL